ncbi:MAG TPA: TonB-dependent receptor [Steroidobacteraceae bacterium]|nr:TonB-dependent receptor [Steroidobacteraceae bacterium]
MGTSNVMRASALATVCLLQFAPLVVRAQSSEPEEIVVTARKRDESFRDVPMSVSVFTEQAIESAGIQKPGDFISLVPNMTLVETQNAGNAFVVVRGVSQARNSEPSVAVLVDGVLETNPAEFNQELFDIQQIEVLKGPQGALYGRNAIGGAILIRTREPTDHFEGSVKVGVANGPAERAQVAASGPLDGSNELKYRASVNFYNTRGYLDNVYLHEKADPARDYSGRWRMLWKPNGEFTGDFRISADRLDTRALYFVIPRSNEANPFSTFTTPPDANNVSTPITADPDGVNIRDLLNTSLKLDFNTGYGTITSISAFEKTREILTGDAFDFRPSATSIFKALLGFDLNQSQFLNVKAYSQELRFTAPKVGAFSWIGGAYFVHTDRFISTGNMVDTGAGVFPIYYDPRLTGPNPSATFLADTQNNNAWAVFGDATYELTNQVEFDAALRFDRDSRRNTTDTPTAFLPDPSAHTGEVRDHTWSKLQPKATLRYKPEDNVTLYGSWSRGFRSGGFNQTGVGAVARANNILGVNDLFEAEVADTVEVGAKGQFLDRRLNAGLSLFRTRSRNGYFFVFLAANSTQNLGNLDATYKGAELELAFRATKRLDLYANFGYTDSEITRMADPKVIGNQAPLVSRTTLNVGAQYRQPLPDDLSGTMRLDFQQIGRTWWDPYNVTSRDPVSLVDVRMGLEGGKWALSAWSKNLFDKKYNTEFSPGGFLWKALPRLYGVDLTYRF